MASLDDLLALDLRVGTVVSAHRHPTARTPAFVLALDFGALGTRVSSAQLTDRYTEEGLVGRRVVCALGLPPRRVAGVVSECLVLAAVPEAGGGAVLLGVADVPAGSPVR